MVKIFKSSCTEFVTVHTNIPLQDPSLPLYPNLLFSLSLGLSHQKNSSFNLVSYQSMFYLHKHAIYHRENEDLWHLICPKQEMLYQDCSTCLQLQRHCSPLSHDKKKISVTEKVPYFAKHVSVRSLIFAWLNYFANTKQRPWTRPPLFQTRNEL